MLIIEKFDELIENKLAEHQRNVARKFINSETAIKNLETAASTFPDVAKKHISATGGKRNDM